MRDESEYNQFVAENPIVDGKDIKIAELERDNQWLRELLKEAFIAGMIRGNTCDLALTSQEMELDRQAWMAEQDEARAHAKKEVGEWERN